MSVARAALAVLFAVGCSAREPAAVRPATDAPPAVVVAGGGVDVRINSSNRVIEDEIYAPVGEAWVALGAAWKDLDFPVAQADEAARTLRSRPFRAPRRIGGKRLVELFDCGYSIGGQRAELWEVTIEIVTALRAVNPARTSVSTMVAAIARPREGTSTDPVPCQSKSELERILLRQLAERTDG